jgi:hypothetical protein
MRAYTTKEKAKITAGGHYGMASRAGHRISIGTMKEAANCGYQF